MSFADLGTLPIFDDAVYYNEALFGPHNQNEDDLDEIIANEARESGIEDVYKILNPEFHDQSTALSTLTVSSDSIHSQETHSTGITSDPSRTSKDTYNIEPFSFTHIPHTPHSRTSLSAEHHDAALDPFRPIVRHTHSSSSGTTIASGLSTASQTKSSWKHKHASKLRSMFRREPSASSFRARPQSRTAPSSPRLHCGHRLSDDGIRKQIKEDVEQGEEYFPDYSGKSLARPVLAMVLAEEHMGRLDIASKRATAIVAKHDLSHGRNGALELAPRNPDVSPPLNDICVQTNAATRDTISPSDENCLNKALANEAFRVLRDQQREQFQRIAAFEERQRQALASYHHSARQKMELEHQDAKAATVEKHKHELEQLENRQLEIEEKELKTQAQEVQNIATAIKYMEGYCSGSNEAGFDMKHTVTDDDRKKLQQKRTEQSNLPRKHENTINVLRAKQERYFTAKKAKQGAQIEQMDADDQHKKQASELLSSQQEMRLDNLIGARRRRAIARWDLKMEIWRRDFETQHGTSLGGIPPHEEWPSADPTTSCDPTSALASYFEASA